MHENFYAKETKPVIRSGHSLLQAVYIYIYTDSTYIYCLYLNIQFVNTYMYIYIYQQFVN